MGQINLNLNGSLASSISATSSLISSVVNGFLVSPNSAPAGVSGFLFHIIDDEEMFVDSDVTDNFVEQNYATQDHVALKPIHFTLKGLMGELVDIMGVTSNPVLNTILALASLTAVNPTFNTQDAQVYSAIALKNAQAQNVINNIPSLSSLISNLTTIQTQQQAAFNFFLNMRNNRQLVSIQTPFGLLTNYIIENFRSLQPGDSRFMSHFTVTFKQIQVVSTAVAPTISSPNPAGTGVQTPDTTVNAPTVNSITSASAPVSNSSDNLTVPSQADTSGRITDMTSSTVLQGQTSGLTTDPNSPDFEPIAVGNQFEPTQPMFNTINTSQVTAPAYTPPSLPGAAPVTPLPTPGAMPLNNPISFPMVGV